MDSAIDGVGRRRLLGWSGLAAAGVVAAGAQLAGARPGHADSAPTDSDIPPATRPGGAYDKYVAKLAAEGRFSGVVLLSHRGRTVLSRSYGMADEEKEIRNHEDVSFTLSSAGGPFLSVAAFQLVQQGKMKLYDTVGTHLKGYAKDISEQVTLHHLLIGTAGLDAPELDVQRIFNSQEEVHEFYKQWARQAKLVSPPGSAVQGHNSGTGAGIAMVAEIIEILSGMTYWDYVQENVFKRCGMTGTAFYTRPQWLTDEHIAHPYMALADGSVVDAIRNLDKSGSLAGAEGKNPGRAFIDMPGTGGGFATAPDLVRFANALSDGTLLDRPYAELLTGAKIPHPPQTQGVQAATANASFKGYFTPVRILNGQWVWGRGGANPGVGASWTIYPDIDWVGVVLSNRDGAPLQEMSGQEAQAVMDQP